MTNNMKIHQAQAKIIICVEEMRVSRWVSMGVRLKIWNEGVPMEEEAVAQAKRLSGLPFIHSHVALMPDAHVGRGATIGTVVPTVGAIIPAAVGVDIGCGMCAVRTSLHANQMPAGASLTRLRSAIEEAIPHGRTSSGKAKHDVGAWDRHHIPDTVLSLWKTHLEKGWERLKALHPALEKANSAVHLGTLGTGNHFLELCLDENDYVWCMLHTGSRGVGNKIGTYFISQAQKEMDRQGVSLEDRDLSYLTEGTTLFHDYMEGVNWAQKFASYNRKAMMGTLLEVLRRYPEIPAFETHLMAVDCHHNYVQQEFHFDKQVYLTRKGAVSAKKNQLGIIPGSMGAKSFIVRGLGNAESFHSCSHGAGRRMSRSAAKKQVSMEQHVASIRHVECRRDRAVLDETPLAYKDIDAVIHAQRDLIQVVHTLRQILCVKG